VGCENSNPMTDSPIAMEEVEVGNFTAQTTQGTWMEWRNGFLKIFDSHLHGSIPWGHFQPGVNLIP